jgi:hypothetical protein
MKPLREILNEKYWAKALKLHLRNEKRLGNPGKTLHRKAIYGGMVGTVATLGTKLMGQGGWENKVGGAAILATAAGGVHTILQNHINDIRNIRRHLKYTEGK